MFKVSNDTHTILTYLSTCTEYCKLGDFVARSRDFTTTQWRLFLPKATRDNIATFSMSVLFQRTKARFVPS